VTKSLFNRTGSVRTYDVTFSRVHVAVFAVERQQVLRILSVRF